MDLDINKKIKETLEDKLLLNKNLLNEVTSIVSNKVLPLLLFSTTVETDFTIQGWTNMLEIKMHEGWS